MLDKGDPGSGQVDTPHVQSLVLIQTLVKLVRRVALGQDTLTCVIEPYNVRIRHFTNDAVDGIYGSRTPEEKNKTISNNIRITDNWK